MFYLGNFRIDNTIQIDVESVAKAIKRDIRFLPEPMPMTDNPKFKVESRFVDGFGSIAVFDEKRDCSKFWIEFEKVRKRA